MNSPGFDLPESRLGLRAVLQDLRQRIDLWLGRWGVPIVVAAALAAAVTLMVLDAAYVIDITR